VLGVKGAQKCTAELIFDWVSLDHASPIGSSFSILSGRKMVETLMAAAPCDE
jgi:hypothetical protein